MQFYTWEPHAPKPKDTKHRHGSSKAEGDGDDAGTTGSQRIKSAARELTAVGSRFAAPLEVSAELAGLATCAVQQRRAPHTRPLSGADRAGIVGHDQASRRVVLRRTHTRASGANGDGWWRRRAWTAGSAARWQPGVFSRSAAAVSATCDTALCAHVPRAHDALPASSVAGTCAKSATSRTGLRHRCGTSTRCSWRHSRRW